MSCRRVFAYALCAILTANVFPPVAASPQGAHLAYDQISRSLVNSTPPPPGAFDQDASRIAALPPLPSAPSGSAAGSTALGLLSMIPLVGAIAAMAQQAASMAFAKSMEAYSAKMIAAGKAYQDAGVLQRAWFYGGWTRLDSEAAHASVIEKPEKGETVFLDLAQKTYAIQKRSTDSNVETYDVTDAEPSASATIIQRAVTESLAPITIAGIATRGFRTTAAFTTESAVGACAAGAHTLDEEEYVSDVTDPEGASGAPMTADAIARDACFHTTTGSHYALGRLFIFRSTALSGSLAGDVVLVTERGNIRELSDADSKYFDIPTDFKERATP
ncbi:MAG: hypothetical protein M3N13_01990 [Candidatus Eremiobacteraeota bacterium]|nr:hypothetical protein [Candidatus Eremiobacteraeota bacterium]